MRANYSMFWASISLVCLTLLSSCQRTWSGPSQLRTTRPTLLSTSSLANKTQLLTCTPLRTRPTPYSSRQVATVRPLRAVAARRPATAPTAGAISAQAKPYSTPYGSARSRGQPGRRRPSSYGANSHVALAWSRYAPLTWQLYACTDITVAVG